MSELIADHFDAMGEFDELLEDAALNAETEWEETFVDDLQERYDLYKDKMYLSGSQVKVLRKIAYGDQ